MADASKGLYAKLADAIAEVEHVAKDGTNEHFRYRYTSAEEVYRELRGPLLKRGLVFVPSVIESTNGGDRIAVTYHMEIHDAESGEVLRANWIGEGQDKGDKASYKAATGACKTFLRHLFMLPADDDPEADAATDKPKTKRQPTKNNASATTAATAKQVPAARKALKASRLSAEAQAAVWKWGVTAPKGDGNGHTLSRPAADAILDASKSDHPDAEFVSLAKRAGVTEFPVDVSDFEPVEPKGDKEPDEVPF